MLKARGKLLATSVEDRQLRYRLLPFGEAGSTNKGRVLASAGAVEVPAEPLPVNLEHDHTRPLGHMTVAEDAEGLEATVDIARTRAGDDVLEEAAQGLRAGISVEIDHPVIRAGRLIAGKLSGAGLVVKPAYPSALLMAADFGDEDEDEDDDEPKPRTDKVTEAEADEANEQLDIARAAIDAGDLPAAAAAIAAAQEEITPTTESESNPVTVTAAAAPASTQALLATIAAAMGTASPLTAAQPDDALTLNKFAGTLRGMSGQDSRMTAAALDTITQADMYDPTAQPAYLGELWTQTTYTERFAPLVSHENLTAMSVKGWRWVEGKSPIVDDWDPAYSGVAPAETMTDIPTGEVVAEAEEWFAKRIAGGNRFDRVHIDFPVPGVLESFLREQAEYIKRRRDARVQQHLVAAAAAGKVVGTGKDIENAWRKIILGAMHVLDYSKPTYAIVGNDVYRELLGTDMLENLAMLDTTLGLESGSMAGFRIQPAAITDATMNGKVIVGAAAATVLHEPGGAPIRVDAQELLKGAVDKAVFSYYLLRSDDRGGIVEVGE